MKLMIAATLLMTASSVSASGEVITERDLMKHYVAELESEYIGQPVDLYDGDAVHTALKKHQLYLMLCSHKFASNKCEQAAQELSELDNAQTAHFKFQNDLAEMRGIRMELNSLRKGAELNASYFRQQACTLPSGEIDQDCIHCHALGVCHTKPKST